MKAVVTARMMDADMRALRDLFSDIVFTGWGKHKVKLTEEQLADIVAESQADVLIVEFEHVTERVMQASRSLKLIACCRNEPEASVDVDAATRLGIPVLSGAGRNAVSVAEFTIGLMLALSRNIAKSSYKLQHTDAITGMAYSGNDQLKGPSEWSLDANAPFNLYGGPELNGKIFGVVGLGTIGRPTARLGAAFGMKLHVFDPYLDETAIREQCGGVKVSLAQLMSEADFISLHAKVTPETTGLIGRTELALIKPTAYIVNTARAAIMDYDALHDALRERRIAGAALDVFPQEPIGPDNPFLALDNVLLTPHLAGSSWDIPSHHSRMVAEDVTRYFRGESPARIMNARALRSQT
jgi:D-3-phosphoglycerate dehydrogenase